ncbi:hypothetical protein CHU98_g6136 [Xylaria longipes]|nr:hypothetical protein CHU98_g6136 [Xylaria longipes]
MLGPKYDGLKVDTPHEDRSDVKYHVKISSPFSSTEFCVGFTLYSPETRTLTVRNYFPGKSDKLYYYTHISGTGKLLGTDLHMFSARVAWPSRPTFAKPKLNPGAMCSGIVYFWLDSDAYSWKRHISYLSRRRAILSFDRNLKEAEAFTVAPCRGPGK